MRAPRRGLPLTQRCSYLGVAFDKRKGAWRAKREDKSTVGVQYQTADAAFKGLEDAGGFFINEKLRIEKGRSKYRGVDSSGRGTINPWRARITNPVTGKSVNLGHHPTEEAAFHAVEKQRIAYINEGLGNIPTPEPELAPEEAAEEPAQEVLQQHVSLSRTVSIPPSRSVTPVMPEAKPKPHSPSPPNFDKAQLQLPLQSTPLQSIHEEAELLCDLKEDVPDVQIQPAVIPFFENVVEEPALNMPELVAIGKQKDDDMTARIRMAAHAGGPLLPLTGPRPAPPPPQTGGSQSQLRASCSVLSICSKTIAEAECQSIIEYQEETKKTNHTTNNIRQIFIVLRFLRIRRVCSFGRFCGTYG